MAYKTGDRDQLALLPPSIDEYIGPHDPVRIYNSFVESLDFNELGIELDDSKQGPGEYYPKTMMKVLLYGYSYGIRSSRKLERALHHNLSFMWLAEGLKPDYRTIARFRSANTKPLKEIMRQSVKLCMKLNMVEGNTLFVDSTKLRANASIDKSFNRKGLKKQLKRIDERIDRILVECETIDSQEYGDGSFVRMRKELSKNEAYKRKVEEALKIIKEEDEKERTNLTDKDCTRTKGRQGSHAGYLGHIGVDEKNGFIVSTEVSSQNNDSGKLNDQVKEARKNLEKIPEAVCADAGYSSVDDIDNIDKEIKIVVPSRNQAQKDKNKAANGMFRKENFKYDKEKNVYICPAGKVLKQKGKPNRTTGKITYAIAKSRTCKACPYYSECTNSKRGRNIYRLIKEELKETLEQTYKSKEGQKLYAKRKSKVELVFGHIKKNLGFQQFLLRGKLGVESEFSVAATNFNLSRLITILGVTGLLVVIGR